MTVYFDPRKASKPVEEMTEDEKNQELGKQVVQATANLRHYSSSMLIWGK